jgi:hypothetical protein
LSLSSEADAEILRLDEADAEILHLDEADAEEDLPRGCRAKSENACGSPSGAARFGLNEAKTEAADAEFPELHEVYAEVLPSGCKAASNSASGGASAPEGMGADDEADADSLPFAEHMESTRINISIRSTC